MKQLLPFLCAVGVCGCGVPGKTVYVDDPIAGMRAMHEALEGPDVRLKMLKTGTTEEFLTVEKKNGSVTMSNPTKKSETVTLEAAKKDLGQEEVKACESNLKNLATANEMWSTDHNGRYPTSASQLTPDYLKKIMSCPAAGKDTYSEGYTSRAQPDVFTFYCQGGHHKFADLPDGYPQYNAIQGLISIPP